MTPLTGVNRGDFPLIGNFANFYRCTLIGSLLGFADAKA